MDVNLLVNLRSIEDHCIVRVCSMKRGGRLTHKHFQLMVKRNFTSVLVLNEKIKVYLGWDESPPTCHVYKKLRDEGLHTFKGMMGYCMKDNGE